MISDARLREMASELVAVAGVRAVALGGSRARGTHRPDSDVDLGLYYDRATLDLDALRACARRWAGADAEVAGPGAWGPWVDGGAWLRVDGTAVDWILRDVARVREQCERARRGQHAYATQPGHPLGFLDVAYAGEVAVGVPLADPEGVLHDLRARVEPYPSALRSAIDDDLWQVDFLLDGAAKGAGRGDVAYVAVCASHAVLLVAHAWHAAAGSWVVNEKGVVVDVARLPMESDGFAEKAADALAALGRGPDELALSLAAIRRLPRPPRAPERAGER